MHLWEQLRAIDWAHTMVQVVMHAILLSAAIGGTIYGDWSIARVLRPPGIYLSKSKNECFVELPMFHSGQPNPISDRPTDVLLGLAKPARPPYTFSRCCMVCITSQWSAINMQQGYVLFISSTYANKDPHPNSG